jgi:hypothetical protein
MTIIPELIQALEQEIVALKKGGTSSSIALLNGRLLRRFGGLYIYSFAIENLLLEEVLMALEDSPATLEVGRRQVDAHIVLTRGLYVEVGIETQIEAAIPRARLITSLWWLLELLKKRFTESLQQPTPLSFAMSDFLFFGNDPGPVSLGSAGPTYSPSSSSPNDAQQRAIESSYDSRSAFIWGPPGTGKTKTIAKAVEAHLNAGRRVLLVSHANNAVDEALEDIAEQLQSTPFYAEGRLIRLGKPQETHLSKMEQNCPLVLVDKVVEQRSGPFLERKDRLRIEIGRLDARARRLQVAIAAVQEAASAARKLAETEARLAGANLDIAQIERDISYLRKKVAALAEKQERGATVGLVGRLLGGPDAKKLQVEIEQATIVLKSKQEGVETLRSQLPLLAEAVSEQGKRHSQVRAKAEELTKDCGVGDASLEKTLDDVWHQRDETARESQSIDAEIAGLARNIISEAKLLATTLTKTFSDRSFPDEPFDVLILDEASMAPLPHVYWAANRCRQGVTVVGDFLQLPPICISEEGAARKWLDRSIYEIAGIDSVPAARRDPRVTLLDEQYRMVPMISGIPNELFYGGLLKNAETVQKRQVTSDGVASSPLVLVDTGTVRPWASRLSSGSRFNLYSALTCVSLAERLIRHGNGIAPMTAETELRIGIMTPYAAQARLMTRIAKDKRIGDRTRISTIHRFQGGEESIVIFDPCDGYGTHVGKMLDDTKELKARRLLNVAMTRPRDRLYFVGDTRYLLGGLGIGAALADIIKIFLRDAERISAENFTDSRFAVDFESWAEKLLSTPEPPPEQVPSQIYTERNFWAQFLTDLKMCRKRVIIMSPFIALTRTRTLMDCFRALSNRGVIIRIFTKPVTEQTGEMAEQAVEIVEHLRCTGVDVVEKRKMHQKVAILDETIVWEGSLNILSHRDTGEHMRRFEGQATAEELVKSLELEDQWPTGAIIGEPCPGSEKKPNCGGLLVVRGKHRKFLGCTNYPRCNHTQNLPSPLEEPEDKLRQTALDFQSEQVTPTNGAR